MELYHHGIKGMKWGVRRFQDKNGKRTAAGKKRYSNGSEDSPRKGIDKKKVAKVAGLAVGSAAIIAAAGVGAAYLAKKGHAPLGLPMAEVRYNADAGREAMRKMGITPGPGFETELKSAERFANDFMESYRRRNGFTI